MGSKLENVADVHEPGRMASVGMGSGSSCAEQELAGKEKPKGSPTNLASGSDDAAGRKSVTARWSVPWVGCEMRQ